jgi:hypothetical protein
MDGMTTTSRASPGGTIAEPSVMGIAADKWNRLTFSPVETTALRIETQLQSGFSGGLLGWKIR